MTPPGGAVAIIPVRVESQRLPRKAMLAESGQALFLHTWEQTRRAACFTAVYVATDSDEIEAAAVAAGAQVIRTGTEPRTGSERCAEAAAGLAAEIVVDVQGDWPEIAPEDLTSLVDAIAAGSPTATLAVPLSESARLDDPNTVKVVRGLDGRALYFSRAAIPYPKSAAGLAPLRHIGVYAFTGEVLARIPDLPSSGLAETESLEQLRFLENGIPMQVLDARHEPWGIETERDYRAFLERLAQREVPRS